MKLAVKTLMRAPQVRSVLFVSSGGDASIPEPLTVEDAEAIAAALPPIVMETGGEGTPSL